MEHRSIAIIGFGDIGARVSARLPPRWRAIALRRRVSEVPRGVRAVAADLSDAESLRVLESLAPDALLVTLSPGARDIDAYREGFAGAMRRIVSGFGAHRPDRAFFLSSTRVYAEKDGGWVDESAPLALEDPHVAAIVDAEESFRDAFPDAVVLRAGGLYGHAPGPLLRAVTAQRLRPSEPAVFGNRIHRDDAAGYIVHALEGERVHPTVNLVDDGCVTLQEVERWLCEQLRLPYAPISTADDDAPAPRHKRIRNERLHDSGFSLRHPDFRSGYADVLREWTQFSEREDGLDLH
ncbi:MAG: epimerase [Pseudomonadota bacterium]